MRWLLTLALLALVTCPAAAQENEAEKLFRIMEQKIRSAKTLQLRFEATITGADAKQWKWKGTLVLGAGDKLRVEGEGILFGEEVKFTVVSDGTAMKSFGYTKAPDQPKQDKTENEKSPKAIGAYFRGALLRDGFFLCFLNVDRRSELADLFTMSDFKLAGAERIGARNTQVIQFKVKAKGKNPNVLSLTVWLDTKTKLPVKLGMTGGDSDISDITETYSEFTIDATVDAKLFELPKVVPVPAQEGANAAEILFRQLETKLHNAKTLQVRFDATLTIAGIAGSLKGKTVLGDRDQVYYTADLDWGGRNSKTSLVGTGTKLFVQGDGNPVLERKDSPKSLGTYLRTAMARFAVFFVLEDATKGQELANVNDAFQVSDFKLGAKEKVAGAEAQVVEYTVVLKGKEKASAKLWINTQTNLPAKLEVRLIANGLAVVLSETYTEYALDGKLAEKLFGEPK